MRLLLLITFIFLSGCGKDRTVYYEEKIKELNGEIKLLRKAYREGEENRLELITNQTDFVKKTIEKLSKDPAFDIAIAELYAKNNDFVPEFVAKFIANPLFMFQDIDTSTLNQNELDLAYTYMKWDLIPFVVFFIEIIAFIILFLISIVLLPWQSKYLNLLVIDLEYKVSILSAKKRIYEKEENAVVENKGRLNSELRSIKYQIQENQIKAEISHNKSHEIKQNIRDLSKVQEHLLERLKETLSEDKRMKPIIADLADFQKETHDRFIKLLDK